MKKQDYIDAINEIKVEDKLKKETLEKVKEKKNYTKRVYSIATAIIVFVIAISIAIPININKKQRR